MIHELSENVFSWKGLRIHTVRVSDDYIRGSIPMHRHAADSLELHVILGGKGSVRTPAGTFPLQAGSFFLTHGEAEHEQRSDAGDPMRELCFYATYETGRAKTDALSALAHPFRVAAANEDILLCARQAAKELSAAKEGFEDALGSLFRLILIYAARTKGAARSDHAPAADGSIYLKIEEAFLYQFRTLTLAGLARGEGLSERQLQRLLRERYDQTFTQKRTEARMRAANLLLAEGRLPITRIAGEVGYSGPEHFCAEYKKCMGMTAREYRRQNTRP